jgi:hypothetical protein
MEDSTLVLVVGYFIPMILNMLGVYSMDKVKTLGDFLKWGWIYFLPIANFIGAVAFLLTCLEMLWNKIKNIKIK